MRYLLDTKTVSELVRNPLGPVMQRILDVGEGQVCTSVVVAAELRSGAVRSGSGRLKAQVDAVLGHLDVLPFKVPADANYGVLRAAFEQAGQPSGGYDLLVAAHAVALGYTIVTPNERDFARVEGLVCENWLGLPPCSVHRQVVEADDER